MPCVVADTSPLFYLAKLDRLSLLRHLYNQVHVPPEVWGEALAGEAAAPGVASLFLAAKAEGWLVISTVTAIATEPEIRALDAGECEAITLARELRAMLIIDEKRGRAIAAQFGLEVTGTLGVLLGAKQNGLIPALKPELSRLRRETGFRLSAELERHALHLVGEDPS